MPGPTVPDSIGRHLACTQCAGRYRGPSFWWAATHLALRRLQFSRPRYSLSREPFGGCRRLRATGRNAMTSIQSRSRTLLLAVLVAALPASIPAAAQQPVVNPSPPSQPAVPRSAEPGAGPGSQPLVSPPPSSAQAPATAAPGQAAQAPAPAAQGPAPPSWMQGAPSTAADSKLA